MEWVYAVIVIFTAWTVLRVIGNERARMMYCVQVRLAIARLEKERQAKRAKGETVTVVG